MRTVAVITATTGRDTLKQTIESVRSQTYPCRHYVFTDGVTVSTEGYEDVMWCHLPVKTGVNGIMNGGIAAASAYLVQEDMMCWLDDDNWFDPTHVEELVKAKENKPYAYSLRKLLNPDGTFFDYDDFESIGKYARGEGFIDFNCYLMERHLAIQVSPLWYDVYDGMMVGDRHVYKYLKNNNLPFGDTGKYSVNYRLNEKRDIRDWFKLANAHSRQRYQYKLPWVKSE